MNSQGIVYLVVGMGYAVRFLVSLCSLRRVHPELSVTVLHANLHEEFLDILLKCNQCDLERIDCDKGKKKSQVTKSRVHEITPYDQTIFLDADTIVLHPFADDLFKLLETHEILFTQMTTWRCGHRPLRRRMESWISTGVGIELAKKAIKWDLPAINTGVFACQRDAEFFQDWHELSSQGAVAHLYIPEEIAANLLLAKHPHYIIGEEFNASITQHQDRSFSTAKIVHFHGQKGTRVERTRGACRLWLWWFDALRKADPQFATVVEKWAQKQEKRYLQKGIGWERG